MPNDNNTIQSATHSLQSESQNVEYKESWRDDYLKWICGFANAQGGRIYLGVNDAREVIGLEEKEAHKLTEDIPNKVRDILGIIVDVNLLQSPEHKEYIEIIVEPQSVPINYKGQYHYRTGSTKQELKGVALQQFILKKMGRQWDDIYHETATISCIEPEAIQYFVRKGIRAQRLSEDIIGDTPQQVLDNLHLISEDGHLKNAAILMFSRDPLRYFTAVQFKIGRFGKDEADLLFQDIIEGNILQMADRVIQVLKAKYLISPIHYEGMQRQEPLEIPETALREILYNAIIHKQYTGAPIQMRVYTDRIELWNDGPLPEDYTVETLWQQHSSKPRNHNIAEVFYKAGFIESWGRGYKKIREGFETAGMPLPQLESHCGGVLITIYRKATSPADSHHDSHSDSLQSVLNHLTQRQIAIVQAIQNDSHVTVAMIAAKLKVSASTINRELKNINTHIHLHWTGTSIGGHWEIAQKVTE